MPFQCRQELVPGEGVIGPGYCIPGAGWYIRNAIDDPDLHKATLTRQFLFGNSWPITWTAIRLKTVTAGLYFASARLSR
jgi:hypothetical protein